MNLHFARCLSEIKDGKIVYNTRLEIAIDVEKKLIEKHKANKQMT